MASFWDLEALSLAFGNAEIRSSTYEEAPNIFGEEDNIQQNIGHSQTEYAATDVLPAARDETELSNLSTGFEFNLNPFSFVLRRLKIPVLGAMDLIFTKSKYTLRIWTSFLYKMLPLNMWGLPESKLGIQFIEDNEIIDPLIPGRINCITCGQPTMISPGSIISPGVMHLGSLCYCDLQKVYPTAFKGAKARLINEEITNENFKLHNAQNTVDYIKFVKDLINFDDDFDRICHHEDKGEIPGIHRPKWTIHNTSDGLSLILPEERHRGDTRYQGLRCNICYQGSIHGICPKLESFIVSDPPETIRNPKYNTHLVALIIRWRKFCDQNLLRESSVVIISLSRDRIKTFVPKREKFVYIILHNDLEIPDLLRGKHKGFKFLYFWVPLYFDTKRFLGAYRVLLPLMTNIHINFIIVNEIELPFYEQESLFMESVKASVKSICTGCVWPFFAGHAIINPKGVSRNGLMTLYNFYAFGGIYGWDEFIPITTTNLTICSLGSHHPVGFLAPQITYDFHYPIKEKINIAIPGKRTNQVRYFKVSMTRRSLFLFSKLLQELIDDSRLTFWHVLSDPRPVQPRRHRGEIKEQLKENYIESQYPLRYKIINDGRIVRDYEGWDLPATIPMENVLQELIALNGGIRFFSFGTHGDVVPLKGICEFLSCFTPHVSLILLNDKRESKIIMEKSEQGKSSELLDMTLDAMTAMSSSRTGINFCPEDIAPSGNPTFSLKPPPDIIFPFNRGLNPIIETLLNLVGLLEDKTMSIGAYSRPGYVPRSANGITFLKPQINENEGKYNISKVCVVQGSSTIPIKGYPEAIRLGPCDHEQELKKYSVVVCPGGAGVVQTAASSGCRVVTTTTCLDRNYRNPHDAGLGVHPLIDPDNIFLALAKRDIRFLAFWLRKNLFRPDKLLSFYGYSPIFMTLFRLLMLYILYSRIQKQSVVSTDPLTTLFLTFRPLGLSVSLKIYALAYMLSLWVDNYLKLTNTSYYYIGVLFMKENYKLSINPVAVYIAQKYGLLIGFITSNISSFLGEHLVSYFRTWRRTVMPGIKIHRCYLEFSLRLHYIPVIHTALVCPSLNKRYEGGHRTIDKSLYVFETRDGGLSSNILIPTELTYQDMLKLPVMSGTYGPMWNCSTGLYATTSHLSEQMGVARGYLLMAAAIAGTILTTGLITSSLALWFYDMVKGSFTNTTSEPLDEFKFLSRAISQLVDRVRQYPDYYWRDLIEWYISFRAPFGGNHDEGIAFIEKVKKEYEDIKRSNDLEQINQFVTSYRNILKLAKIPSPIIEGIFL